MKNTIFFFVTVFVPLSIYFFFDIFILKQGDIIKWGSELGAFKIALFFGLLFEVSVTIGHILFLIIYQMLNKHFLVKLNKLFSILSGLACLFILVFFSSGFYLPAWIRLDIFNDVFSLTLGWAIISFFISLFVFLTFKIFNKFNVRSF
jgi:hypothetical protein